MDVLTRVLPFLVALLIAAHPVAATLCDAWCAPMAQPTCEHAAQQEGPGLNGNAHGCIHGDALAIDRTSTQLPPAPPADVEHAVINREPLQVQATRFTVEYPPPLTAVLSSITPLRV